MMPRWLRSYFLMVKWTFLSNRPWLSLNLVVQLMIAIGFIYGIGFFYPTITPETAKFLTAGAPTLILLTVGLVMVPQVIAMARQEGTFEYIWSLPVPRMVHIAADATNVFGSILPGVMLSVALGAWHFHFSLAVSPLIVPAFLLTALCGTFLGYTMAFSISRPMVVNVMTQVIVFVVMLFSPVMFPADRLPGWLQAVHQGLPIRYMADISRGTLTDLPIELGKAFAIVGAWFVAGFIVTWYTVRRRR